VAKQKKLNFFQRHLKMQMEGVCVAKNVERKLLLLLTIKEKLKEIFTNQ
jgi:hypothetical protein